MKTPHFALENSSLKAHRSSKPCCVMIFRGPHIDSESATGPKLTHMIGFGDPLTSIICSSLNALL
jgi:hypothetical protein